MNTVSTFWPFLKCIEKKLLGFKIGLFLWNFVYPIQENIKLVVPDWDTVAPIL